MREHPSVVWRKGLSEAWYRAAYAGLIDSKFRQWAQKELEGLDATRDDPEEDDDRQRKTRSKGVGIGYPAELKDRILKSLSYACWKSLAAEAANHRLIRPLAGATNRETRETIRSVEKKLCQGLGLHPATVGRWDTRKMHMDGNKVLGAFAVVLKRDIHEVRLKGHRELIWEAVRRTLGVIRASECRETYALISEAEFRCVRLVVGHPLSDDLLERPASVRERIFDDVYRMMDRDPLEVNSRRFVATTLSLWSKPYMYFRAGLRNGWEFLDDVAAGQA